MTDRPGYLALRITGKDAAKAFCNEAGGHRFQRVPPTEKRGRVHSSTITISVLPEPTDVEIALRDSDLDIKTVRGSGPGGQHRNKTETAVQITHKPTGISVRAESERSQLQNKEAARALLRAKLKERMDTKLQTDRDKERKAQVGSGMRGDKVRTVALQRGRVTDHRTGKEIDARRYLKGYVEELWK